MSETFVMRGYQGRTIHTTILREPEVRGCLSVSGPQAVGGNGAPEWVAKVFDANPLVERIMLEGKKTMTIYQRIAVAEGRA